MKIRMPRGQTGQVFPRGKEALGEIILIRITFGHKTLTEYFFKKTCPPLTEGKPLVRVTMPPVSDGQI